MEDQKTSIGGMMRMMRRDVDQILRPEATSPFGKYTAMTLTLMLEQLALFHGETADAEADEARARLIDAMGGEQGAGAVNGRLDFEDRSGRGAVLTKLIATRLPGAPSDELNRFVGEIAATELAALNREKAAVQEQVAADLEKIGSLEVPINAETLDRYFAQSDHFTGARTKSVWQIPGGYSKDTYMVSIIDADGRERDVVLRRDFPFGPTETSAADEFDIIHRLANAGLPVARPITSDRSAILGQPFLVTERVDGENAADYYDEDPALAKEVSLQLAKTLGQLHALDPVELGLADASIRNPQDQIRLYLAQWHNFWTRNRITGSPMAEAAFAWLDAHTPAEVPRLVAVHGDARQHNVMISGSKLTALLDWEFIHAGDPAEDLEYTRLYLEPYLAWDEFTAAYLAAGGVQASESGSRYYEVFRALRNFVCCDVAWSGFVTGKYPVNKLAVQGFVYRRDFLRNVGEALTRFTVTDK